MPQVSKRFLDRETSSRLNNTFSGFFSYIAKRKKTNQILEEFFTRTEKSYMTKRLMIGYFLIKEIDYDTISKVLKVSRSTIYGVSQRLKSEKGYLQSELRNYYNTVTFKRELGELLEDLLPRDPRFTQARLHTLEHQHQ